MRSSSTVESAPQSLTLSLRISEVLRKRLEDIRKLATQKKGGNVSTSEIAKQLLESAREDRLEVVDLLAKATEAVGYSDETDQSFRTEPDHHSGGIRSGVGAKRRWLFDCAVR